MDMWNRVRSLWENEQALESAAEALLFSLGKMIQPFRGELKSGKKTTNNLP